MKSEGICCGVPKLTNNVEVPIAWRSGMIYLNALLLLLPTSVRKLGFTGSPIVGEIWGWNHLDQLQAAEVRIRLGACGDLSIGGWAVGTFPSQVPLKWTISESLLAIESCHVSLATEPSDW